jgi:hypothetical protein
VSPKIRRRCDMLPPVRAHQYMLPEVFWEGAVPDDLVLRAQGRVLFAERLLYVDWLDERALS